MSTRDGEGPSLHERVPAAQVATDDAAQAPTIRDRVAAAVEQGSTAMPNARARSSEAARGCENEIVLLSVANSSQRLKRWTSTAAPRHIVC